MVELEWLTKKLPHGVVVVKTIVAKDIDHYINVVRRPSDDKSEQDGAESTRCLLVLFLFGLVSIARLTGMLGRVLAMMMMKLAITGRLDDHEVTLGACRIMTHINTIEAIGRVGGFGNESRRVQTTNKVCIWVCA